MEKMKAKRLIPKKNKNEQQLRLKAWKRLHDMLGFTPPLDGVLTAANNHCCIDLFRLEKRIPNYNGDKCMYKGKPKYSMKKAIIEEWGEEAANLIEQLI